MKPFFRQTWAEVDLDALKHNVLTLETYHHSALIAVIKANAYGHGDVMVAQTLERMGVAMLAVATLDEALNLRLKGIQSDVLVMGYVHAEDLALAREHNIILTVVSYDWLERLDDAHACRVHLKIDTGMNRLGLKKDDEIAAAMNLIATKGLILEGIYTHFASSDNPDNQQTQAQYNRFEAIVAKLNYPFKWIHSSNSGAVVNFKAPITNAVRIGLSLYGYSDYAVDLKPVLRLYTRLLDVKEVQKGESVGYGANYVAETDELIGTIGIGYADGLARRHQGSSCYVGDDACTMVGRVCMDLIMVRLNQRHPIGTQVELIGPRIDVYALAKHLGTIPYEIFPQLNDRIPRVYYENQRAIAVLNARYESPSPLSLP
jgi:alanine racemase